jgi:hypothetical protein
LILLFPQPPEVAVDILIKSQGIVVSQTSTRGLAMRVFLSLAILTVCLSTAACNRPPHKSVYAQPPTPSPAPTLKRAGSVKPAPELIATPQKAKRPATKRLSQPNTPKPPVPKETGPVKITAESKQPAESQNSKASPAPAVARFEAAQEKASITGVHTLTQEDIEGLTYEQLRTLRGY